jgi:hypothetical protein
MRRPGSPGLLLPALRARRRLGDGADLQVADLGSPLPFPDGAFDDVIASLVTRSAGQHPAPFLDHEN